jgi:hypothetical protein
MCGCPDNLFIEVIGLDDDMCSMGILGMKPPILLSAKFEGQKVVLKVVFTNVYRGMVIEFDR